MRPVPKRRLGRRIEREQRGLRTGYIDWMLCPTRKVAHAVIFIAENDALAGQVLTLNAGSHLRASREGLGASDNSYG
jgi:hypothetical protein